MTASIHRLTLPPATDGEEFHGSYATEAESAAAFDRLIADSGLFRSYAEVEGRYLAERIHRQARSARIDRILVPTKKLEAEGWIAPIGIELKRSGEKLGPALCQAIDYTYAAFELKPEWWIHLRLIFLWPLRMPTRSSQSLMVQNGIGAVFVDDHGALRFESEHTLIRYRADGPMSPGTSELRVAAHVAGRKVGSR